MKKSNREEFKGCGKPLTATVNTDYKVSSCPQSQCIS